MAYAVMALIAVTLVKISQGFTELHNLNWGERQAALKDQGKEVGAKPVVTDDVETDSEMELMTLGVQHKGHASRGKLEYAPLTMDVDGVNSRSNTSVHVESVGPPSASPGRSGYTRVGLVED